MCHDKAPFHCPRCRRIYRFFTVSVQGKGRWVRDSEDDLDPKDPIKLCPDCQVASELEIKDLVTR